MSPDHSLLQTETRAPNRTMRIAAMSRAAHALRGEEPKLLRDSVAQRLLGYDDEELLAQFDAQPLSRFPGFHLVFALRNRLVEDEVAAAAGRGPVQYVILGAGLDSFAYRSPELANEVSVFEVDHPGSSAWKRQRVAELGLPTPGRLHFVPAEFGRDDVAERLQASGLDRGKPVVASMLGVSQYLSRATLSQLLQGVATLSQAGCTLIMEYVPPLALLGPEERETLERSIAGYARDGEPWLTFVTSDDLTALLTESGFTQTAPVSHAELEQRYFQAMATKVSLPATASYVRAVAEPRGAA